MPSISFHAGVPIQAFSTFAVVGDFNNDGKIDIAVNESGTVGAYLGNGDGTFGDVIQSSNQIGSNVLDVADFNADGRLDLVGADTNDHAAELLYGNGDGSFQAPVLFEAGQHPTDLAVVDFDGDGRPDVAMISSSENALALLLNDGAGGFQAPVSYSVGTQPTAMTVGDFNGDGKPDVATANIGAGTVSVQLNDGAGGFQSASEFGTGPSPTSLAAGDFNGDGKDDLAVVDSGPHGGSIMGSNGDGTFQFLSNLNATGNLANHVVVADFNQDGRLDVAYSYTTTVAIDEYSYSTGGPTTIVYALVDNLNVGFLEGRGDGSFTRAFDITAGSETVYEDTISSQYWPFTPAPDYTYYPVSVATDDLDVNGFPDLALADNGGYVYAAINDALPPTPDIAINNTSVTEGNSGTTNAVFTVRLSAPSAVPVTVQYATADGTATAGSDYQSASGTLTFAPGETTKTISVPVIGDRLAEPNETFLVNLSQAVNADIAAGQGTGTIVDDEPRISINDVAKLEGKKGQTTLFVFTVTLSAAYDQPVTVSYQSTNGTATTRDGDYVAKTGTLTFNPGETTKTITITVNGDSKKEADESFFVDLFANSSNSLFKKSRGTGTILNDD
jgi:hypothetical protein